MHNSALPQLSYASKSPGILPKYRFWFNRSNGRPRFCSSRKILCVAGVAQPCSRQLLSTLQGLDSILCTTGSKTSKDPCPPLDLKKTTIKQINKKTSQGVSSSEKNTTTKTKEGGRVTGKDLDETGGGTLGWPIREDCPERQLKKEREPPGRDLVREHHSLGLASASILQRPQAEVTQGAQT